MRRLLVLLTSAALLATVLVAAPGAAAQDNPRQADLAASTCKFELPSTTRQEKKVATGSYNIRKRAAAICDTGRNLAKGQVVTALATKGSWTFMREANGNRGWVHSSGLATPAAPESVRQADLATSTCQLEVPRTTRNDLAVARGNYNIRYRAEATCDTGRNISKGSTVEILASKGNWRFIETGDGFRGWVYHAGLSIPTPPETVRQADLATSTCQLEIPDLTRAETVTATGNYNIRYRAEGGICDTGRNVAKGEAVTAHATKGSWTFIATHDGFRGWVHNSGIAVPAAPENPRQADLATSTCQLEVPENTGNDLATAQGNYNIRHRAEGGICDTGRNVSTGQVVDALATKGSWVFIQTTDGFRGWVHENGLTIVEAPSPVLDDTNTNPPEAAQAPAPAQGVGQAEAQREEQLSALLLASGLSTDLTDWPIRTIGRCVEVSGSFAVAGTGRTVCFVVADDGTPAAYGSGAGGGTFGESTEFGIEVGGTVGTLISTGRTLDDLRGPAACAGMTVKYEVGFKGVVCNAAEIWSFYYGGGLGLGTGLDVGAEYVWVSEPLTGDLAATAIVTACVGIIYTPGCERAVGRLVADGVVNPLSDLGKKLDRLCARTPIC